MLGSLSAHGPFIPQKKSYKHVSLQHVGKSLTFIHINNIRVLTFCLYIHCQRQYKKSAFVKLELQKYILDLTSSELSVAAKESD